MYAIKVGNNIQSTNQAETAMNQNGDIALKRQRKFSIVYHKFYVVCFLLLNTASRYTVTEASNCRGDKQFFDIPYLAIQMGASLQAAKDNGFIMAMNL